MKHRRIANACVTLAVTAAVACGGNATTTGESAIPIACQGGDCAPNDGVGDACTPSDESNPDFPGFAATEINVEDHATSCKTGICLVAHFQGRVSCPYGGESCTTPSGAAVSVNVAPELVARPPSNSVYCSCRCDGPAGTGPFCACPASYECAPLVNDVGGAHSLAGSYCIETGTAVQDPTALASGPACDAAAHNCDGR